MATTTSGISRNRRLAIKKHGVRIIVLVSLAWTIYGFISRPEALQDLWHQLHQIPSLAALVGVTELCFVVGAGLVATKLGIEVFRGAGWSPISWTASILRLRKSYRDIVERSATSRITRFGFHLNWLGAVGTMLVVAISIVTLLPKSSWGLLILPAVDIAASFGWRLPIQTGLTRRSIRIRPAKLDDMVAVEALDRERYEDITPEYADDALNMFVRRFKNAPQWFWVMQDAQGGIVGLLSLMPTDNRPSDFKSWEHTTSLGTLDGQVAEVGEWVYVVALTMSETAAAKSLDERMIAHGIGACISRGISHSYFSGRMPGYYHHPDMTPEEYYNARITIDGKLVALDRQIRRYESWGMRRIRLVKNGFQADFKSAGYGVLFQFDLPFSNNRLRRPIGLGLRVATNHAWLWRFVKHLL